MKENLKMICSTEKEFTIIQMEIGKRVNIKMINMKEEEFIIL